MRFTCKICNEVYLSPFEHVTNLNKHLIQSHFDETNEWFNKYRDYLQSTDTIKLSDDILDFINFFVTSNLSLNNLKNTFFMKIIDPKFKIGGNFSLRYTKLPQAVKILFLGIEELLKQAYSICLIIDIWTNEPNIDFIALGAFCINSFFERELVILNMMEMPGPYTAEVLKEATEQMINQYEFDKSKIHGNKLIIHFLNQRFIFILF